MKNPIGAITLDHSELTIRLLEIGIGLKRPSGKTAKELMIEVKAQAVGKQMNEKTIADFERMAATSIEFFAECAAEMQPIN